MSIKKNNIYKYFLFIIIVVILISCGRESVVGDKTHFATTNYTIASILREITGDSNSVSCLVPPGTSIHVFTPRPSDIEKLENAIGIVYVSESLDGWVVHAQADNKFMVFDYLPDSSVIHSDHNHGHEDETGVDPHFWTDPVLVMNLIPKLTEWMINLNPNDSLQYAANSMQLINRLEQMHLEFLDEFKGKKGNPVLLYHPSFLYFLKRYGLEYAGSIEESPGKEPSFRQLAELRKKVKKLDIKILYAEPQMPERTLQVLSDGLDVLVLYLDPVGGGDPGRDDYFKLMRFNAKNLIKSQK